MNEEDEDLTEFTEELSWPNAISFSMYYGIRALMFLIFVFTVIPLALIFGIVFPEFFKNLAQGMNNFVEQELVEMPINWTRLSSKD